MKESQKLSQTVEIERQAWSNLAKHIVDECSPEEGDFFTDFVLAEKDTRKSRAGADDPLAFGPSEIMTYFTPMAIQIARSIVKYIVDNLGEVGGEILQDLAKDRAVKWFSLKTKNTESESFTRLRARIMDLVTAEAVRQGLESADANALAKAVHRRLNIVFD